MPTSTENPAERSVKRNVDEVDIVSQQVEGRRKRRKFVHQERPIEPVRGKPSMKSFQYEVYENEIPTNLHQIERKDNLWMMSCALHNDTPMWRGWNTLTTVDDLPKQNIRYMENIHLPPTRLDVVRETLKRSQAVAQECSQKDVVVHYDLAIAKPAMQLQSTEAPRFDNVFIYFGPFHIEMTYFACVGYFLEASGGPQILNDTDVLAQGSLNGFLSGGHFNRCKRIHTLLATAVQILHFRQFLEQGDLCLRISSTCCVTHIRDQA
jgi:hypothetical protein